MNMKTQKNDLIMSCIVTLIFTVVVIIGLCFHETWYDEAQAYLIARDASLHDIMFYLTHYEGHPPLWHLMLKVAHLLGLPYPLALKSVQFICYEAVLIMIEFFSPFRRPAKIIIPMSFFILYQYGVTSRPYILLLFATLAAAAAYRDRKKKPVRYTLALILMCLCHSYGIALAGGIVVADMVGEAIRQRSVVKCIRDIFKSRKILVCYIILLIIAVLTIADIMPYSDTFGTTVVNRRNHSVFALFLQCWFFIPAEALITSFSSEVISMQMEVNPFQDMFGAAVVSVIVWALLTRICYRRKMIAEMIIPYFCISVLLTSYSYPHHFGTFLMYLLFILWTASDIEPIKLSEFTEPLKKAGISEKLSKRVAVIGVTAFAAVNLYWDGFSFYREITGAYDASAGLADWIKENGLEGRKIMTAWLNDDTHMYSASAMASEAYFEKNIYYNIYNDKSYISHIIAGQKENEEYEDMIRSTGAPEFIVCDAPRETINICMIGGFDEKFIAEAYYGKAGRIFKDKEEMCDVWVYCTKDTYKELYGKDYVVPSYKEG